MFPEVDKGGVANGAVCDSIFYYADCDVLQWISYYLYHYWGIYWFFCVQLGEDYFGVDFFTEEQAMILTTGSDSQDDSTMCCG
jgi:hypothetical protein